MVPVHAVLVPTDFSETSDLAVDAAIEIARLYGAKLMLLHVYTVPVYSFPDGAFLAGATFATELESAARKGLERAQEQLKERGVEVVPVLREGIAEDEIASAATELGAGLIVVGTHARRGVARALLGSTAEAVIRTSHVPVLVVPPERKSGTTES